jgi:hypothetical protein
VADEKDAYDRVAQAVAGKPLTAKVKVGKDEHGDPVFAEADCLVAVAAGDTFALASLVPKPDRTDVVRDLRFGTCDLARDREVRHKVRCVRHLLEEVRPYLPAAAADEQAPAPPAAGPRRRGRPAADSPGVASEA